MTARPSRCRATVGVVVAAVVLATVLAPAVAGATADQGRTDAATLDHADPAPAFAVAVEPDWTGVVHITYAYDLDDDTRAAAFEELRTNETAVAAFETRFRERIERVADDASAAAGRDMGVDDVDLSLRTVEETGIVEVSVTWHGLATVDGDRLELGEPFASGFAPDRPLHVLVPDGYEAASIAPTPDAQTDGRVTWDAGSELDGFEVVLERTDDAGPSGTEGASGPGFAIPGALVAIAVAILFSRRR